MNGVDRCFILFIKKRAKFTATSERLSTNFLCKVMSIFNVFDFSLVLYIRSPSFPGDPISPG